jgi:exonuclease SbcC
MRLHRLTLRNFCQFRDRSFAFDDGLNMLVGPNGAGKTNIIRALQLALTGDAGGGRTKASDIYQGADKGDPAYVELHMSHAGAEITVRRGLQGVGNELVIGDKSWTAVSEINNELFQRLAVTKQQISDYVFVRQRKIDDMFDQRPAERAASLAALFGIEHAEKVYKKLGEFISNVEIPTTTMDADELRQTIQQLAAQCKQLLSARNAHGSLEAIDNDIAAAEALVASSVKRDAVRETIVTWQREYEQQKASLARELEICKEHEQACQDLQAGLDAMAADCRDAQRQLEAWAALRAAERSKKALDAEYAAWARRWQHLQEPVSPHVQALSEEDTQRLHQLREQHETAGRALRSLEASADVCPTCGQAMPGVDARRQQVDSLKAQLAALAEELTPLEPRDAAWRQYTTQQQDYRKLCARRDGEKQRLDTQRGSVALPVAPVDSEETLRALLAEQAEFSRELQKWQRVHSQTRAAAERTRGHIEGKEARLAELREELQELPAYTAEVVQAARDSATRLRIARTESVRLEGQLAAAEAKHAAVQQQLDDVMAVKKQGERARAAVEHLQKIRHIFHRNEAPRMASYTYVEQMLGEVNRTLELFEAPYRVEMDENLGFMANFLDGVRKQPDSRLSVGERIVLAIGFRITVNSTFAGQVGVLIMDEPTAGLDEQNLGNLPQALMKLRDLSHDRGLQVIFVTHEPRISHLFDHTIELAAA